MTNDAMFLSLHYTIRTKCKDLANTNILSLTSLFNIDERFKHFNQQKQRFKKVRLVL